MLHLIKQAARTGVLALVVALVVPAIAAADAPDITGATAAVSGQTVTISGSWAWTTHHTNCNNDRAGVGIAIDWNDANAAGNHVTTLNGVSIDVGTPSDNVVHNTSGGAGSYTCGTFNGTYNTGAFGGLEHTYSGTLPDTICALAYDVHGQNGTPSAGSETVAGGGGRNLDNSAEKNGQTPAGHVCAPLTICRVNCGPPPPPPPPPGCTVNCGPPPPGAPAIGIAKSGPASATAGSDVPFTLTV